MQIPKEIKEVKRPVNTVVRNYFGKYKVVKRTCKYIDGKNMPIDKEILGEIIDFKFVPFDVPIPVGIKKNSDKELCDGSVDIKDYGNIALFIKHSEDVLSDLKTKFSETVALKLYVISILRCCYPKVVNRDLKHKYQTSYLSEIYKNVGLSESLLPDFFDKVGRHYSAIEKFMIDRLKRFQGRVQIVDATLKSYNANESVFSRWSRKGKIKGSKDFILLYTYDLESKEPIYHRPYAGNMLDSTVFDDYINNIPTNNEILIGDKGFKTEYITDQISKGTTLRYLFPLKRNTSLFEKGNMSANLVPVSIKDKNLVGSKTVLNGKFYYTFKDLDIEALEKKANFNKKIKSDDFNFNDFEKESKKYGTVIFESNVDLQLEDVYTMYESRWEIEEMFNFYKNILELSNARLHNDMRIYTTEFINYLSLIIGCRVKNELIKLDLHKKYSFKQILDYLTSYKKQSTDGKKWRNSKMLNYVKSLVDSLGI